MLSSFSTKLKRIIVQLLGYNKTCLFLSWLNQSWSRKPKKMYSIESLGIFSPLGHAVTAAVTIVMLLVGFLLCFVGRKYIKFSLFVFGFCVGAFLVVWAAEAIPDIADETVLIVAGIFGIILGSLCLCVLRVGQAAIVGGGAFTLGIGIVNSGIATTIGSNIILWIILIVALLMLLYLAYKVWQTAIVVATSISGALLIVVCACFLLGVPVNIIKAVTAPSSILCPNFSCAGFTIAWFLLSLFGFAVQTRISKSDDDGKDNLSSTTNSYDDVFAIGENVTSSLYSRKVSLQKRKAVALTKMAKKARGKSKKKKRNQQTSRKKSGKKQKYSKVELNARNDMV